MTALLGANWRRLVASALFLPLLGIACQSHGAIVTGHLDSLISTSPVNAASSMGLFS